MIEDDFSPQTTDSRGDAKASGKALVPATSKALTVLTEQEQKLAADVARWEKTLKIAMPVPFVGMGLGVGGCIAAALFPVAGVFMGITGATVALAGLFTCIATGYKLSDMEYKLSVTATERKLEKLRITSETRQKAETATAEAIKSVAQPLLEKLAEKPDLAGGDVFFFDAPPELDKQADSRHKLALCVTEITRRQDVAQDAAANGSAPAEQYIFARVYYPAPPHEEFSKSREVPGVGALSILRPAPPARRLRLPAPPREG